MKALVLTMKSRACYSADTHGQWREWIITLVDYNDNKLITKLLHIIMTQKRVEIHCNSSKAEQEMNLKYQEIQRFKMKITLLCSDFFKLHQNSRKDYTVIT